MPTPFPDCVPELTDGVIRLRAHREADIPRIVEQCQDPESLRWTTIPRPYAEADARRFLDHVAKAWEAGDAWSWAITRAADPADAFLGSVDLRLRGDGVAEIGFGLHPDARGHGLMTRAVRLVAAHFFGTGGRRVHWAAAAGNLASWRTVWKAGFAFHAELPDDLTLGDGLRHDAWTASLHRDDPMTARTPWPERPDVDLGPVRLRAWRDDDVEVVEEFAHPDHFVPVASLPTAANFAQRLAARERFRMLGTGLEWCIADAESDRALGWVTVFVHSGTLADDAAELGYALFPSAHGRGIGTLAASHAVRHAFAPAREGGLGLRRLTAMTAEDNVASNRILERLGFALFGREREVDVLPDGTTRDLLHWDLLARDWRG